MKFFAFGLILSYLRPHKFIMVFRVYVFWVKNTLNVDFFGEREKPKARFYGNHKVVGIWVTKRQVLKKQRVDDVLYALSIKKIVSTLWYWKTNHGVLA